MENRIFFWGIFLCFFLMVYVFNGCSLVCLGLGTIIDASKPDSTAIPNDRITTIGQGTKLQICLMDKNRLAGKYVGTKRMSREEYSERYLNKQKMFGGQVHLPSVGDTVDLNFQSGIQMGYRGAFLYFDNDCVELNRDRPAKSFGVPLKSITGMTDDHGRFTERDSITKYISTGQIPVLTAITIQNESGRKQIPLNEVSAVKMKVRKKARLTGFFGGLIIDGMLLYLRHSELSQMSFDIDF